MSAMRIHISREGVRALAKIDEHAEITERVIRHAWFELGKELRGVAQQEIRSLDKRGRVYFIRGPSGRRRRHIASAPGQSHANRSRRLERSISWKIRGDNSLGFGYGVSITARDAAPDYAAWVEFGTRATPTRPPMAARPSLLNAVNLAAPRRIQVDFGDELEREFRS